ncbi:MAG: hypothetical protein HYV33_06160 [Candidatus Kerfeldbacteria bacterium]|nr:hypothetical protein [Candidatus Kerfeldbacteria bacterium]
MTLTKIIFTVGSAVLGFYTPAFAGDPVNFDPKANDPTGQIQSTLEENLGLGTIAPTVVALDLINQALTLLGAVSLMLLLYGGFLWVWARGNEEQVGQAKQIIQGTIIGLVIVFASLGITRFVFTTVADITNADYNISNSG